MKHRVEMITAIRRTAKLIIAQVSPYGDPEYGSREMRFRPSDPVWVDSQCEDGPDHIPLTADELRVDDFVER